MKQVNCSLKQLSIIQDGNMECLDAERSLLSAGLDRADVRRERLAAATTLFKVLGGGWQVNMPTQTQASSG